MRKDISFSRDVLPLMKVDAPSSLQEASSYPFRYALLDNKVGRSAVGGSFRLRYCVLLTSVTQRHLFNYIYILQPVILSMAALL